MRSSTRYLIPAAIVVFMAGAAISIAGIAAASTTSSAGTIHTCYKSTAPHTMVKYNTCPNGYKRLSLGAPASIRTWWLTITLTDVTQTGIRPCKIIARSPNAPTGLTIPTDHNLSHNFCQINGPVFSKPWAAVAGDVLGGNNNPAGIVIDNSPGIKNLEIMGSQQLPAQRDVTIMVYSTP